VDALSPKQVYVQLMLSRKHGYLLCTVSWTRWRKRW